MKQNYDVMYDDINKQINSIMESVENIKEDKIKENDYLSQILKYRNIETITREVIVTLINKIEISGSDINIDFNFKDEYKKLTQLFAV